MVIAQGDVFWCRFPVPFGSEPGYRRPVVVVQNDAFNRSGLRTTLVCILTTNLRLAASVGNVTLARGEANLPHRSVANITQLATVDRGQLGEKIGTVSRERLLEVLNGVSLLLTPSAS